MGIARISCGQYLAGHDVHVIAVDRTYGRPGIDGTLTWEGDHAVLGTLAGRTYLLYNHRPDVLSRAVPVALGATLLEDSHLLWVLVRPNGDHPGGTYWACFNVSPQAAEPCDATKDVETTPSRSDTTVLEGGN